MAYWVGSRCRLDTVLVLLRKKLTAVGHFCGTLLDICWTLLFMEFLTLFLDKFGRFCWTRSLLLLDTLVIIVGQAGHYCCWTCWSLLLLDTLVITVGHVGQYCWTLWSLLLDKLVITVVGQAGHYCCWTRWSLLFDTLVIIVGHVHYCWTRWSLLLLDTLVIAAV
jgi:hypothetical protein